MNRLAYHIIFLFNLFFISYAYHQQRFIFYRSLLRRFSSVNDQLFNEAILTSSTPLINTLTPLQAFHEHIKSIHNITEALDAFMSIKVDINGQRLMKTHESLELIISIICTQRQWILADKIIHYMKSEYDIYPNEIIYKDLIKYSSFAGHWIEGRRFLQRQIKYFSNNNNTYPPPKSYLRVLRAMSKAEVWREVTSFYMQSFKGSLSYQSMKDADKMQYLYEAMLFYNAKCSRWREAVAWMNEIKSIGLIPSRICYRHAIEACTKASKHDVAKTYLDELEEIYNKNDIH